MYKNSILGIMQPYFFPYWGHFALIEATQRWIIFDVTQYTPKMWMNRNRILHPNHGWQYINAPIHKSSISLKTFEAKLSNPKASGEKIIRQLAHYRNKAPYYENVIGLLENIFSSLESENLVDLNALSIKKTCEYLDINFEYEICSRMNLNFPDEIAAGEWAPLIASQVGASHYINPLGGREIFNVNDFNNKRIKLSFLKTNEFRYTTPGYVFEPNLSILDVMMWCTPNDIKKALKGRVEIILAT
jgi:hypothetical protein